MSVGRLVWPALLLMAGFAAAAKADPLPDANEMRESVVRIIVETDDGGASGTGFIINNHRTIVTNNHVVQGAKSITIGFMAGGKPVAIPARLVDSNAEKDIAIIEAATDIFGEPVELANYDTNPTMTVTAVGYPGAADEVPGNNIVSVLLEPSYSIGTVSRILPKVANMGGDTLIQHTAVINHGNSGGPLFDACGRVIGINSLVVEASEASSYAQGIFYSIDIRAVLPMLDENVIDARIIAKSCVSGVEAKNDIAPATTKEVEAVVFDRFAACVSARPCDAEICKARYLKRVSPELSGTRQADVALRMTASAPLCTQQNETQAYAEFQNCVENAPCDFDGQCAPALQQSLRPEIMKKRQVLFDRARANAKDVCQQASAPGLWRGKQTEENVWTATVFNDSGAALTVSCVVSGDKSGDGALEIDDVKGKRDRWAGTRSVLMSIDEYSEPLRLDLQTNGDSLIAGVLHKETQTDRGWLKDLLGKLTIGGAVTLEEPKVELDETFSLDGSKDALTPCLNAKIAQQSDEGKTAQQ